MKFRKTFSIRRRGPRQCEMETQDKLFKIVDRHYKTEMKDLTERFEKVAVYVNDVFCALANYDVRFEFDPLSLDDCRCEIISDSEINLICELKHLPECYYEVQGDGLNGAVKIKLTDDFRFSCDHASWDDVCTRSSRTRVGNVLNTRALLDVFTASLGRALSDVWSEHRNVGLVYRVSGNLVSIYVDIPDEGFFKITLIPALRLTKGRVRGLSSRTNDFFQSLGVEEDFFTTVYAVAKPSHRSVDELWRLTFNNLENRILHSPRFPCGHHCLYTIRHLMSSLGPSSPRSHTKQLSSYQLQLVVVKGFAALPNSKAWAPAKFQKRLVEILTSLKSFLKEGSCENPFTGINVFADLDEKSLKVLIRDVDNAMKSHENLLHTL